VIAADDPNYFCSFSPEENSMKAGTVRVSTEKTDKPVEAIERLNLVLGGHLFFQALSAAVQLQLFDVLSAKPRLTRAQIAKSLGIAEKPARILLLSCTAVGLIKKSGEKYSNSSLAEQYLTRKAAGSFVPIVMWQHYINYKAMFRFCDALKANRNVGLEEFPGDDPTLYQRLARQPELEKIFQQAMQAISVQANQLLAKHVDFSKVKNLLDVGGGNGTNIITLAKKYPHLRASVFDSPTVCKIAEQNIASAGLSNRCGAVPGNCFTDEFPADFDCILFAHFFTIWSEEKDLMLLKKCYRALPKGGSVILFNMMQSDKEDGPLTAAMGSPYFLTLATGEGMLYTWSEYASWMKAAGFKTVRKMALPEEYPTGHGAIIGVKA
jgi:ubiquinone/menaquinone biosynthesis C-methylase UbiE